MSVYYLDVGDLYLLLSSGTRLACMSSRHLMAIVLGLGGQWKYPSIMSEKDLRFS